MSGYPRPAQYGNSSESVLAQQHEQHHGDSTAYLGGASSEKVGPYGGSAANTPKSSNKKKWWIIGGVLFVLVAAGAIVGGVLGSRNNGDDGSKSGDSGIQKAAAGDDASAATTITSVLPNGSTTTETANPAAATSAVPSNIKALPQWSWTGSSMSSATANGLSSDGSKTQQPMVGLAIGNWLVLENWMNEPWFNATANNNASIVDEWGLMQHLGDSALSTMQEHWSTWFTEADVESAHQAGINHLRLPVGYWAFLDASQSQGDPYLFNAGQLDYLQQALGWAYKRNMYAIIDLHGLPGSQNGEITSGHKTSNPTFFTDAQQSRADATVDAALQWINTSPYRSIISALELANEPRPYTQGQFTVLRGYYQRAYEKASTMSNPLPVQCHHGFPNQVPQVNETVEAMWMDFFTGKDPELIQLIEHPYIGTFPLQNNEADMLNQVCNNLARYSAWPVPVLVTEWSLRTGVSTTSYERQLYAQQMVAWAHVGGSNFWAHRAVNGGPNNNGGNSIQWSFLDLIEKGSIPMPTQGQSTRDYLNGLQMNCQNVQSVSWANTGSGSGNSSRKHKRSFGNH